MEETQSATQIPATGGITLRIAGLELRALEQLGAETGGRVDNEADNSNNNNNNSNINYNGVFVGGLDVFAHVMWIADRHVRFKCYAVVTTTQPSATTIQQPTTAIQQLVATQPQPQKAIPGAWLHSLVLPALDSRRPAPALRKLFAHFESAALTPVVTPAGVLFVMQSADHAANASAVKVSSSSVEPRVSFDLQLSNLNLNLSLHRFACLSYSASLSTLPPPANVADRFYSTMNFRRIQTRENMSLSRLVFSLVSLIQRNLFLVGLYPLGHPFSISTFDESRWFDGVICNTTIIGVTEFVSEFGPFDSQSLQALSEFSILHPTLISAIFKTTLSLRQNLALIGYGQSTVANSGSNTNNNNLNNSPSNLIYADWKDFQKRIREFQKANSLRVTGVLGGESRRKLNSLVREHLEDDNINRVSNSAANSVGVINVAGRNMGLNNVVSGIGATVANASSRVDSRSDGLNNSEEDLTIEQFLTAALQVQETHEVARESDRLRMERQTKKLEAAAVKKSLRRNISPLRNSSKRTNTDNFSGTAEITAQTPSTPASSFVVHVVPPPLSSTPLPVQPQPQFHQEQEQEQQLQQQLQLQQQQQQLQQVSDQDQDQQPIIGTTGTSPIATTSTSPILPSRASGNSLKFSSNSKHVKQQTLGVPSSSLSNKSTSPRLSPIPHSAAMEYNNNTNIIYNDDGDANDENAESISNDGSNDGSNDSDIDEHELGTISPSQRRRQRQQQQQQQHRHGQQKLLQGIKNKATQIGRNVKRLGNSVATAMNSAAVSGGARRGSFEGLALGVGNSLSGASGFGNSEKQNHNHLQQQRWQRKVFGFDEKALGGNGSGIFGSVGGGAGSNGGSGGGGGGNRNGHERGSFDGEEDNGSNEESEKNENEMEEDEEEYNEEMLLAAMGTRRHRSLSMGDVQSLVAMKGDGNFEFVPGGGNKTDDIGGGSSCGGVVGNNIDENGVALKRSLSDSGLALFTVMASSSSSQATGIGTYQSDKHRIALNSKASFSLSPAPSLLSMKFRVPGQSLLLPATRKTPIIQKSRLASTVDEDKMVTDFLVTHPFEGEEIVTKTDPEIQNAEQAANDFEESPPQLLNSLEERDSSEPTTIHELSAYVLKRLDILQSNPDVILNINSSPNADTAAEISEMMASIAKTANEITKILSESTLSSTLPLETAPAIEAPLSEESSTEQQHHLSIPAIELKLSKTIAQVTEAIDVRAAHRELLVTNLTTLSAAQQTAIGQIDELTTRTLKLKYAVGLLEGRIEEVEESGRAFLERIGRVERILKGGSAAVDVGVGNKSSGADGSGSGSSSGGTNSRVDQSWLFTWLFKRAPV